MTLKNTKKTYGSLAIGLHWLMFFLLVGVYTCINLHHYFPRSSRWHEVFATWHFMLGLSVLLLVIIRIVWRLFNPTPAITPVPASWQKLLAKCTHYFLYLFMLAMPLAGWFMLSGFDHPIPFWGTTLPPLMAPDKDLAKTIKEAHEWLGVIGYYAIGFHTLVALFHHYVVKDNTLKRMLGRS